MNRCKLIAFVRWKICSLKCAEWMSKRGFDMLDNLRDYLWCFATKFFCQQNFNLLLYRSVKCFMSNWCFLKFPMAKLSIFVSNSEAIRECRLKFSGSEFFSFGFCFIIKKRNLYCTDCLTVLSSISQVFFSCRPIFHKKTIFFYFWSHS